MRQQALCNSIYTWMQDKHQHTPWTERSSQSTTGQQQPLQGLQQQASSAVSTNYSGGQAPTEISATGKGKGNKEQLQRKATRKRAQRKRKRIQLQQRLRQGKRTRKRKTSVATSERNRQRTRKEQRSQQPRKRKEPNGSMLQMWPTTSLGQRLQNSSLQLVAHNVWATTRQHGTMVLPYYPNNGYDASWYSSDQTGYYQDNSGQQYQQPQQTPQLALTAPQHTAAQESQTPAIHLVAALNNKMSTTPTASALQSVQQGEAKESRHHDQQWCSNTCLPNMLCAQHTHAHTPTWAGAAIENINRWN